MQEDALGKPRMPRWGKIALVLSLVLNLALLGLAGGLIARAGGAITPLTAAIRALPESDRDALRRSNRLAWQTTRLRGDPATLQAMIMALRAEEFDAAQFSDALDMARRRAVEASARTQTLLIDRVSGMSPAERLDYASQLEARLERRQAGPRWRSDRAAE